MGKQILRVGVAQMFCRRSLQENLDQVLRMIGDVRDRGCDVAVFPESILRDANDEASVSDFDRAVESVKARARACRIHAVVGVSAEVVAQNHNRALVVDRKGEEVLNYQKNNEVPQRIWMDGIPCSVAICSDRWYIEHADLACLTQGSRVMIDISGGHGGDDGRPDLQWVRYRCWAVRNSVFVVVCNQPHDDEPDYRGNDIWVVRENVNGGYYNCLILQKMRCKTGIGLLTSRSHCKLGTYGYPCYYSPGLPISGAGTARF